METGESGTSKSLLPFEEERRRIGDLIDDFLNGLKQIKNASKWDDIEKLRMDLRFLRTFVLFGNSSLYDFNTRMSLNIKKSLFDQDKYKEIQATYGMGSLRQDLLMEIECYMRLGIDYLDTMTEDKIFEYMLRHLHDLPMYCSKLLLPLMADFKILRQVFRHLTHFYPILKANKTTTQYLYPRYQMALDRVTQFCFDLWSGLCRRDDSNDEEHVSHYYDIPDDCFDNECGVSQCSSKITSLLIDIIPLELEVQYICTSKLIKESTSTEVQVFVKQILKASPRILQNYLILLQDRMADVVPVNCTPTQSINVMMEFLLIFLTDIPKRFIHRNKLNDMLAYVRLLTRKISILVSKLLEKSSENNINEADFLAPDLLQEIEQMKGDIKQIFLKAPESSQLRFPMDDGFLFMNLLLRHLNDLLISNVYSVSLITKEIGMVKESLEFLKSSFGKVRQTLDDSSGVVKDCWVHALDVAYEAKHVINSILVRDKALSHLIFSLPYVIDKINLIVAEVTSLQLEDNNGDHLLDAKSSEETIESTSSSFVEVTVGHEEEEARIISQLLDEHESELDVISIVGMPGLGKTTLANKVYNNTLVATHFNVRAWCTVSQKYNKSKVLREILQQVTVSEKKESEDDLAENLRRALLDKRYLIVLDDVWDIATGEMLIACFPKVKRGNRIILTSRIIKVGLQVKCHSDPLLLQLLTPEKSWDLFEKRVFGEQGSCPAELSKVGHKIVEKCKGLPVAVVLIAGVIVKDCWVRALDVADEVEHVINSILVRDKAPSHLIFSLPRVTDKIKLIMSVVTSLQLEDKNGDHPLDARLSNEPVELTVGHEEEEAWIIDQLLDEHESELDVISIVGMPGLGKTTLANKVYKNALVASHFNVRAKCTVSQKYTKSNVLREILQQVTCSEVKDSEDDLADKLRRVLLDKRYLIVLDDVWDIATGEMLIACFPKGKRGNRIILTCRSIEVGLKVKCRSDPLHLQLLTPEKSWELFVKRVFGKGSCPTELSDIGHQIVEKCKGLPLALVLIAGVIVRVREGKKKEREKDLWLKIQHNLDSSISTNINLQMMKVMQLSYDYLPCQLKPLLLYFARSQKSKRTPVSTLMQLWMDEGLVDHDSLEEATQSYLDDLISSSLIMVEHSQSKSSWALSVRIKVCYVHDVVHDFCSVKSKKEKFFKLINSGDPFHASDFLHHRLTIHTDDSQLHKKCVLFNSNKSSAGSKHLISLTLNGPLDNSRYIFHTRNLRLVRVLQLDDIVLEDSLTEEIGSLFHLRFLSIRANIKAIPLSWVNLRNLETLLIKTEYTSMVLVPRILKLSMLKHVTIDMSSFFEEDADNIRILEAENSKLTTLSQVDISYSEGTNDALAKFPNLQHLHCTIMVPKNPPTHGGWFPKFDVFNKLESLIAVYHGPWDYYGYPIEYHFPTSLKELRLHSFTMRPALLSAIAALPELEILEIIDSDFVEDKWDASEDIYQSLKTLRLVVAKFSEWEVYWDTFPKLEELILEYCFMLKEIPCEFRDIDTLKSIRVLQSRRDLGDSAMEIKKYVEAFTGEDRLDVHTSYEYGELSYNEEGEEEQALSYRLEDHHQ